MPEAIWKVRPHEDNDERAQEKALDEDDRLIEAIVRAIEFGRTGSPECGCADREPPRLVSESPGLGFWEGLTWPQVALLIALLAFLAVLRVLDTFAALNLGG